MRSIEELSTAIGELERTLPADHPAWWPLAHARKEWGHAVSGGDIVFHSAIVERDLAIVAQMIAGAAE